MAAAAPVLAPPAMAILFLIHAAGEEVVHRGLVFAGLRGLVRRLGGRAGTAFAVAALASAAGFAAYHYPLHGLSPGSAGIYLLSGLVLAALYQASGGLLAPVIAHSLFNILRVYL